MKKEATATARRALRRPRRISSIAGTHSARAPKAPIKRKTILIPKLYLEGLALAAMVFSLALLVTKLNPNAPDGTPKTPGTSIDSLLSDPETAVSEESWSVQEAPVLESITGTSSLVEPDGTIVLYETHDGKVWRRDSTDGVTFSEPVSTGIEEDASLPYEQRPVIGRASVLQISSYEYLMVYEQSARQRPEVAQVDQPRQLFGARSSDGVSFSSFGQILDSVRHDAGYASDPELLLLPDTSLRLFYTSKGDRIASLHSDTKGATWVSEGERLSRVSDDADVLYLGQYYAMYYSFPAEGLNASGSLTKAWQIRKAYSTDGLSFVKTSKALVAGSDFRDAIDPDILILPNGTVRMYFGLRRSGTSQDDPAYDLYTATAGISAQ